MLRSLFKYTPQQPPDTYTVLPRYLLCQDSLDNSRSPKTMSIFPNWCLCLCCHLKRAQRLLILKNSLTELDVLPEFKAFTGDVISRTAFGRQQRVASFLTSLIQSLAGNSIDEKLKAWIADAQPSIHQRSVKSKFWAGCCFLSIEPCLFVFRFCSIYDKLIQPCRSIVSSPKSLPIHFRLEFPHPKCLIKTSRVFGLQFSWLALF